MKSTIALGKQFPNSIPFLEKVRQIVHSVVPEAEIILYGSRARGDARPFSDWDFLILVDHPVNRSLVMRLRDSLYELELETNNVVSSIIRTQQEWESPKYSVLPFKLQVEQEGVLL